jgi:hypothetical protein
VEQLNKINEKNNIPDHDDSYSAFVERMARETATPDPDGLKDGKFLGHIIEGGVCREVRKILQTAQDSLSPEQQAQISKQIRTIGGIPKLKNAGPSFPRPLFGHYFGFCIDINAALCPYLIHEAGETALDAQLAPAYDEIAKLMRGEQSYVTHLPQALRGPESAVRAFYHNLKLESDTLKTYFSYLDRPVSDLEAIVQAVRAQDPTSQLPNAIELKKKMCEHYVTLTQHPILFNPETGQYDMDEPHQSDPPGFGDRPFKKCDPRDGFLDHMPEDLVVALIGAGLDWGVCAMGPYSGDIMHFQRVCGQVPGADTQPCFSAYAREAWTRVAAATATPEASATAAIQALKDLLEQTPSLTPAYAALKQAFPQANQLIDELTALVQQAGDAGDVPQATIDAIAADLQALQAA